MITTRRSGARTRPVTYRMAMAPSGLHGMGQIPGEGAARRAGSDLLDLPGDVADAAAEAEEDFLERQREAEKAAQEAADKAAREARERAQEAADALHAAVTGAIEAGARGNGSSRYGIVGREDLESAAGREFEARGPERGPLGFEVQAPTLPGLEPAPGAGVPDAGEVSPGPGWLDEREPGRRDGRDGRGGLVEAGRAGPTEEKSTFGRVLPWVLGAGIVAGLGSAAWLAWKR